jgi:hypothetical protein
MEDIRRSCALGRLATDFLKEGARPHHCAARRGFAQCGQNGSAAEGIHPVPKPNRKARKTYYSCKSPRKAVNDNATPAEPRKGKGSLGRAPAKTMFAKQLALHANPE